MNTPVSFEIAKLLKEKGFDIPIQHTIANENYVYDIYTKNFTKNISTNAIANWNDEKYEGILSAPTISLVVMWLYEKHGIWIGVIKHTKNGLKCFNPYIDNTSVKTDLFFNDYDFPTEAYEAAIHYIKENNLI